MVTSLYWGHSGAFHPIRAAQSLKIKAYSIFRNYKRDTGKIHIL